MQKTVFPSMSDMVSDYNTLENNLRDLRSVLCLIAYQQPDHALHVSLADMQTLPDGSELEISFDAAVRSYVFRYVGKLDAAAVTEGTGLTPNNEISGALGADTETVS